MYDEFNARATVGTKVSSLATNVSPVSKSAACAVNPLLPPDSFCKTMTGIVKAGYNFAPNSSLDMIYSRLFTDLNSKSSYLSVAPI